MAFAILFATAFIGLLTICGGTLAGLSDFQWFFYSPNICPLSNSARPGLITAKSWQTGTSQCSPCNKYPQIQYTHARTHARVHAYTHTTCTNTHTRTHTHTYTHNVDSSFQKLHSGLDGCAKFYYQHLLVSYGHANLGTPGLSERIRRLEA